MSSGCDASGCAAIAQRQFRFQKNKFRFRRTISLGEISMWDLMFAWTMTPPSASEVE
jgi:hypothetical protein